MSRKSPIVIKHIEKYIDHTVLKPNISEKDVQKILDETSENGFASACIPPCFVKYAKQSSDNIAICTVISFPFGYQDTQVKLAECRQAIKDGADELDLVVNVTKVKSGKWDEVEEEMKAVNELIHQNGKLVKWIFENSYLEKDEIVKLCEICNRTNPDFAKTSTGFGNYGARLEDVVLMRKTLKKEIAIKASGGIRNLEEAIKYISIGATRIGSSSGISIINEAKQT